jgi:endonuclease/exonuclease/phosphatase family metal-dependent hydrolase
MSTMRSAAVVCLLLCTTIVFAAPPPPNQASAPSPVNGATAVPTTTVLSWAAASRAQRYDVFIGTTLPPTLVSADQTATSLQPAVLSSGTTYFWRVDSKSQSGTTTGVTWSFTTAAVTASPGAPASPSPADNATGVAATSTMLAWSAAARATSYDVAFGASTPPPLVAQQQTTTQFNPGALAAGTTYYWQVTARNSAGTNAGPVWRFTTTTGATTGTTLGRLKLLTWNIQHGYDATNTEVIDDQVALMIDSNADVIGLQEITIEQGKDLSTLYKAKLEAATGYPWNSVWAPAPRASIYTPEGDLILTRLPIVSWSTAAWDTMPGSPDMIGSKRAAAQVQLLVNNQPVNVIVTHLDTDVNTRSQQLSLLLQWANRFPAPRIIGGDFNMMPSEADHAAMAGQFPDAWTTLIDPYQATPEPGYTKDARTIAPWTGVPGRIDYWFHDATNQHAVPTDIAVLKTRRSDHNALLMWVKVQ